MVDFGYPYAVFLLNVTRQLGIFFYFIRILILLYQNTYFCAHAVNDRSEFLLLLSTLLSTFIY